MAQVLGTKIAVKTKKIVIVGDARRTPPPPQPLHLRQKKHRKRQNMDWWDLSTLFEVAGVDQRRAPPEVEISGGRSLPQEKV